MNKIEALEKTIYNLENDVYEYNWADSESCNCGILARTILGGKSIKDAGYYDAPAIITTCGSAFSERAICMVTGTELPEIFRALSDCGFSFQEIRELEMLGNEKICRRCGFTIDKKFYSDGLGVSHVNFSNKKSVIKYLKEWVKMLKEQEEERSVASKEQLELLQSETKRKNITKSLAVFPVEEKSDLKTLNEVV